MSSRQPKLHFRRSDNRSTLCGLPIRHHQSAISQHQFNAAGSDQCKACRNLLAILSDRHTLVQLNLHQLGLTEAQLEFLQDLISQQVLALKDSLTQEQTEAIAILLNAIDQTRDDLEASVEAQSTE